MTPGEIKSIRLKLGLTQAAFAKLIGASGHSTVTNYENGTRKPDRFSMLKLQEVKASL